MLAYVITSRLGNIGKPQASPAAAAAFLLISPSSISIGQGFTSIKMLHRQNYKIGCEAGLHLQGDSLLPASTSFCRFYARPIICEVVDGSLGCQGIFARFDQPEKGLCLFLRVHEPAFQGQTQAQDS